MYENLRQCPICENTQISNFIICKDYTVSGESFAISQCKNCNFKFTNPRPTIESIGKYYESKDYISHSNKSKGLLDIAYKIARYFTVRNKYAIIKNNSVTKGKVLDFGCGTGYFLSYCQSQGWEATGIEPNPNARLGAGTKLKIFRSIDELSEESRFDVITLWHVLEHVHNVKETLLFLRSKLNKNGIICVAVPNTDSYDAKYYQNYWAAYDVPRHLYHFNQENFKLIAKNTKLKVKVTLPMKLDAFYVSILSEKNKTGKTNVFKAIVTAIRSNKWARNHNYNYSSLIYILKK